jgi:hypothetical protein
MSKKTLGIILIVLGVIVLAVCLSADLIGLGEKGGIGWKQLTGAAVGLLVALGGVWLAVAKER